MDVEDLLIRREGNKVIIPGTTPSGEIINSQFDINENTIDCLISISNGYLRKLNKIEETLNN